jgi:hypothetical protein
MTCTHAVSFSLLHMLLLGVAVCLLPAGFRGLPESMWVKDCLNLGVCPKTLIAHLRAKFEVLGGVVYEHTAFKSAVVCPDGVLVTVMAAAELPADLGDVNRPNALLKKQQQQQHDERPNVQQSPQQQQQQQHAPLAHAVAAAAASNVTVVAAAGGASNAVRLPPQPPPVTPHPI